MIKEKGQAKFYALCTILVVIILLSGGYIAYRTGFVHRFIPLENVASEASPNKAQTSDDQIRAYKASGLTNVKHKEAEK